MLILYLLLQNILQPCLAKDSDSYQAFLNFLQSIQDHSDKMTVVENRHADSEVAAPPKDQLLPGKTHSQYARRLLTLPSQVVSLHILQHHSAWLV